MHIHTSRFGTLRYENDDVLTFPHGLIGMESCRRWVLLADSENRALGWLQSAERPELALAVVSPRRFVPGYQVRVAAREVEPVTDAPDGELQVLVVVSRSEEGLTVNLKAPIVVSLETRRGRQVVAKDDHAVRYVLGATIPFRQSA